jgi:thiamine-monophosphate kinase
MSSGELEFIRWIRGQQSASALVPVPAGDDLAIIKWPADELLLVGVDQVLDGVHFDSRTHSPRQIGRKVMNRNLSDCAAMACLPAAAVATVALRTGTAIEWARELYLGLREAADAFSCQIIGGDTASWDAPLAVTVTILGRSAGIQPVERKGARAGDRIYVTGALGGSILGRHMSFTPRIHLARRIASSCEVNAMIDISDSLARDLGHICEASNVGAVLDADRIPIHEDARTLSGRDNVPALDHALFDGEDHELLFTCSADLRSDPALSDRVICIGRITPEPGLRLADAAAERPLEPRGWEHRF